MPASRKKINIAIIDDHPIVIEGLQKVLMQAYQYVSTICFTSGNEFIRFVSKGDNSTDIVLLDISLPDTSGIDLCKQIKAISPSTCVLAFSNHNERNTIMRMLQNGASGYLLKNSSAEEVVSCIDDAMQGMVALSRDVKEIMARPGLLDLKSFPALTKREKEILRLVAEGKTSTVIAGELFLSPLTVETHRRNMMQKLEVNNLAALIKVAMENGLLN